jgi:hypothetical protein
LFGPTFNADDMFPDLLSQKRIWNELDQIVDRVDGRMDRLEALNLMSEEKSKNKFTQKLKKAAYTIYISIQVFNDVEKNALVNWTLVETIVTTICAMTYYKLFLIIDVIGKEHC